MKARIALLVSCLAMVVVPPAFGYGDGSGGGNSSNAAGQTQATANCEANVDKQE